jgi:hypothetical protein
MQQQGLKPDTFSFNIILKKAVQNKQALRAILDLLSQMIQLNLEPQVRSSGRNKKGKPFKPYTVMAVKSALKHGGDNYRAWIETQRRILTDKPKPLQAAWEEFFQKTL